MEKDLIEKYKKEYEEQISKRDRIREIIKELVQLKKNEYVKRYIKLEKYDNDSNKNILSLSNEDILKALYTQSLGQINETHDIYVCIGKGYSGYKNEKGKYVISYPTRDIDLRLAFYKNIETYKDGYIIPVDECLEFEKNHIVLKGNYEELSRMFFNTTICEGEDKAIEKVLSYRVEK